MVFGCCFASISFCFYAQGVNLFLGFPDCQAALKSVDYIVVFVKAYVPVTSTSIKR